MPNDDFPFELALDAANNLADTRSDIAIVKDSVLAIKDVLDSSIGVPSDPLSAEPAASDVSLEVATPPTDFYEDMLHLHWAQLVLSFFILVALLLTLGVSLWQCFAAHMKG